MLPFLSLHFFSKMSHRVLRIFYHCCSSEISILFLQVLLYTCECWHIQLLESHATLQLSISQLSTRNTSLTEFWNIIEVEESTLVYHIIGLIKWFLVGMSFLNKMSRAAALRITSVALISSWKEGEDANLLLSNANTRASCVLMLHQ